VTGIAPLARNSLREAKSRQLRLESAEQAHAKLKEEQRVQETYGLPRARLDWENKLALVQNGLERQKVMARAQESEARTKWQSQQVVIKQEEERCRVVEENLKNCNIASPQDGIVYYYVPEQSRFGQNSPILAVGEPVRDRIGILSHNTIALLRFVSDRREVSCRQRDWNST